MPLLLTLDMYRNGQPVGRYQFDSVNYRVLKIGRLSSAHLALDDPAVSRVHAVIELTHKGATLIDMGSQTGTHVNNAAVTKAALNSGDQVIIGNTGLLIGVDTVSHPVAPQPPAADATVPAGVSPMQDVVQTNPGTAVPGTVPMSAPSTLPPQPDPAPYGAPVSVGLPNLTPAAATAPVAQATGPSTAPTPVAPAPAQLPSSTPAGTDPLLAKIASLSPEARISVESFVDFMVARPSGLGVSVVIGPESASSPTHGGDNSAIYGSDASSIYGSDAYATDVHDTSQVIAASGMKRNRLAVGLAAAALIALVAGAVVYLMPGETREEAQPSYLSSDASAAQDEPSDGAAAIAAAEGQPAVEAEAAGAPTADAAPAEAGADGTPVDTPAEPIDPTMVYLALREPLSLNDVAAALWPNTEQVAILAQPNASGGGPAEVRAPGSVIKIPRTTAYTVRPGDSLAVIARRTLGSTQLYTSIYEANRGVLADPSAIEVGMSLDIPLVHSGVQPTLARLGTVQ